MYLHMGDGALARKKDIVGVFDLDNTSTSHITRAYLKNAEENGEVSSPIDDLPRSFVIENEDGITTVHLTRLNPATLYKRFMETYGGRDGR